LSSSDSHSLPPAAEAQPLQPGSWSTQLDWNKLVTRVIVMVIVRVGQGLRCVVVHAAHLGRVGGLTQG